MKDPLPIHLSCEAIMYMVYMIERYYCTSLAYNLEGHSAGEYDEFIVLSGRLNASLEILFKFDLCTKSSCYRYYWSYIICDLVALENPEVRYQSNSHWRFSLQQQMRPSPISLVVFVQSG